MQDETQFHTRVDALLDGLYSAIEEANDAQDCLDDALLHDGVLTLILNTGKQYVINKHTPSRQIWLSSPVSGAGYFSYDSTTERWKDKQGQELGTLLEKELRSATGLVLHR